MAIASNTRDLAFKAIQEQLQHHEGDLLGLCGYVLAECTDGELCSIAAGNYEAIEGLIGTAKALHDSL